VDVALARHPVMGGYLPRVGNKWVGVLSMIGYVHEETIPGLLAAMGTYPCIYRWSNRFVALGTKTAACEIKRIQKQWYNQVKGLSGIIREVIFNQASHKINHDALDMHQQTDSALMQNSNQNARFGYWTSTIVIMNEDKIILEQALHDLSCYAEQSGFACLKEDMNAFDAWLGTIPGHGSCNARRLFISSNNLAHLLPLNSVWTGKALSSNHSLLPVNAPPVFYASTTGQTPFRFHLDVGDVGHQMVIGPTGAGKSTYLELLIAQFLRYGGAQIFLFDKDYSHQALTKALGGKHYNLGQTKKLAFCPLADLSSASKKMRAQEWVENLVVLQNMVLTPEVTSGIHQAIESLSSDGQSQYRNLTVLQALVQNEHVRSALQYYTVQGAAGFLDGTSDLLKNNYLQTFEMKDLIVQKPQIYVPILQYLFNQIESSLEARPSYAPTLIILEEAWAYVSHPLFSQKLRDWLKTLRKKNARVVFTTQSLTDLYDPSTQSLTATTAAVIESCLTKVYLPHAHMDSEIHTLYQKMGLSHRQIEIIQKEGLPKRHYYVVTPEGDRLIDLELHELALSFLGLSRKKSSDLLHCHAEHGEHWLAQWLSQNKLNPISQE
jgi:type IV secretion system protein VirB4